MRANDITISPGERTSEIQAEQLRCELERQRQFMAMVAHELRNLLVPVAYSIEMLARGQSEAAGPRQRSVCGQVNNMRRLVNDLLDFSCAERGRIGICMAPLDFGEVIQASIDVAWPAIESRRHHLTVGANLPSPMINGDACRLTQIVSNLLINAAKFTPSGGEICVSLEREKEYLVTHVRDNGVGIAADMLSEMFDVYRRGQHDPGLFTDGLGLGLTIARYLVEAHGGTLCAYSEGPGKGSEFVMRLPAA